MRGVLGGSLHVAHLGPLGVAAVELGLHEGGEVDSGEARSSERFAVGSGLIHHGAPSRQAGR
jgi:hypothetical protein